MSGNYKTVAHYTSTGVFTYRIPTNVAACYGTGGINGTLYCSTYKKRAGWIYGGEKTVVITIGVTPYYRQTLRRCTEAWRRTSRGIAVMRRISIVETHVALITPLDGGATPDP